MPILGQPFRHSLHSEGDRKTRTWLLLSHLGSGNWATLDLSFGATENPPFLPWFQPSETRSSLLTKNRNGKAEQITCQVSPKGSHESKGAAERTVQQVRGMARVYLEHVREKAGSDFPPKSPWWAWALRHAAWICNRFHVRADTRVTPHSKIGLKTYAQPGVTVWSSWFWQDGLEHNCSKTRHSSYTDAGWAGTRTLTNTSLGAKPVFFRTRTVTRLTEDKSWSAEAVADMEWTPWKPVATNERQATKGCCWREE